MPRKKKLLFLSCLLVVFLLGMLTQAVASSTLQSVTAYVDSGVKIVLDGNTLNSPEKPILYNDRYYLPVRAVAEAVGKAVTWDGATKTVYLGSAQRSLFDLMTSKYGWGLSQEADKLSIHGKNVTYGLLCESRKPMEFQKADFQLDRKFKQVNFRIGMKGSGSVDVCLFDYTNGYGQRTVIKTVELTEQDGFKEVQADVTGIARLVVQLRNFKPSGATGQTFVVTDAYVE
ncbi:MAG: copper amine oxidase N-terminal domain-containing protein [Bacillota bacterium]